MSIIITKTDKKKLFEFIRWKIDNPHPCRSCPSNFGACTGCDKQKNYDTEYWNKIEGVLSYSEYMNTRKCGYCKNYKKCNYPGCPMTMDTPACSDFEPIR